MQKLTTDQNPNATGLEERFKLRHPRLWLLAFIASFCLWFVGKMNVDYCHIFWDQSCLQALSFLTAP